MDDPATYKEFLKQMMSLGYLRIERDDRIFDIIPTKTREKGIELWEKQTDQEVTIIQLHLPYDVKRVKTLSVSRHKLEVALQTNSVLNFDA